jgi:hypothetical protein
MRDVLNQGWGGGAAMEWLCGIASFARGSKRYNGW